MSLRPSLLPGLADPPNGPALSIGARQLARHVSPLTQRVRRPELELLARSLEGTEPRQLLTTLSRSLLDISQLRTRMADRAEVLRYATAGLGPEEVHAILARHVRVTVPDAMAQLADQRALRRGQIDLECLLEREDILIDQLGARMEVACEVIGGLVSTYPELHENLEASGAYDALLDITRRDSRRPTRISAIRALVATAHAARSAGRTPRPGKLQAFAELVDDSDPWIARAALASATAFDDGGRALLNHAARLQTGPEPFLVRARAVELLVAQDVIKSAELLALLLQDDSELLRFELARALVRAIERRRPWLAGQAALRALLVDDPSEKVRAFTTGCLDQASPEEQVLLVDALGQEGLVRRHALAACSRLVQEGSPLPEEVTHTLQELSRWAPPADARRALDVLAQAPRTDDPLATLARSLGGLTEGKRREVRLPTETTVEDLARALVPYAIGGFGFWLSPRRAGRVKVHRGDQLVSTAWRFVHELGHPAPAKRQGHRHTLARLDLGPVRVPPSGLDEASATEVPGQRVRSRLHDSWVPALPLPDDFLHAASRGQITLVSAEGTTIIEAPEGRFSRLRARISVTLRMGELDRLRRESLEAVTVDGARAYTMALHQLGFRTALEGSTATPPSRGTFRAAVDPLTYLLGLGTNTTRQLLLALAFIGLFFYLRAAWHLRRLRRHRAGIPLVIGGWGTRGKSGTERLKMGLMTGLGLPTLAKTTGCEAMVLHTPGGRSTEELFLFRPFDKASIWEQLSVVGLAHGLQSRVLLWECMALRPSYVDLLQHRWMRDDLSTITNAYADHEDVMGPTGLDVARSIAGFTPDSSCLLTTEGPMRPLLEQEASRRGTVLRSPALHHQELVPDDLLARFPYREHPSNLALASGVAEALGVPRVEALGWMAEHVVPDLGALVVHPPLAAEQRTLVFANGMSANDEISFRHSWHTTGMDEVDPDDPLDWRVTVVNNRADRLARSEVFARIMVNDAPAHRHVLIGTNLEGLVGWIRDELEPRVARLREDTDEEGRRAFLSSLRLVDPGALALSLAQRRNAPRHRASTLASTVQEAISKGVDSPALGSIRSMDPELRQAAEALELDCELEGVATALLEAARRWIHAEQAVRHGVKSTRNAYKTLFEASLHLVEDPTSSGDQIMAACALVAPPLAEVRVFGCQNIKGTGLDFAWQWVWWRQAHNLIAELQSPLPEVRAAALSGLESLPTWSAAVCQRISRAMAAHTDHPELGPRAARLQAQMNARAAGLLEGRAARNRRGLGAWLLTRLERLLDPFDAILRGRRARRIFTALAHQRISHRRARAELEALTVRQKGGWLTGSKQKARTATMGDPHVMG